MNFSVACLYAAITYKDEDALRKSSASEAWQRLNHAFQSLSPEERAYVEMIVKLAKLQAAQLVLNINHPSHYVGQNFYSGYSRFHHRAEEHVDGLLATANRSQHATPHAQQEPPVDDPLLFWPLLLTEEHRPDITQLQTLCEDAVLAELALGMDQAIMPPQFLRSFRQKVKGRPGWFDGMILYLSSQFRSYEDWWQRLLFPSTASATATETGADSRQRFDLLYAKATQIARSFDQAGGQKPSVENTEGTPQQLLAHIKEQLADNQQPFAPVVRQQVLAEKMPLPLPLALMALYANSDVKPPQMPPLLRQSITTIKSFIDDVQSAPKSALTLLKHRTLASLLNGDLSSALFHLLNAEVQARRTVQDTGKQGQSTDLFEIRMLLARLHGINLDNLKAAWSAQKASLAIPANDYDNQFLYLRELATALQRQGGQSDNIQALRTSIEANRSALALVPHLTVEAAPHRLHRDISQCLMALDQQENDVALLEKANSALQQAINQTDLPENDIERAELHTSQADLLTRYGNRKNSMELLQQAAGALEQAANAHGRQHRPQAWAGALFRKGNLLTNIGRRFSKPEELDRAIESYKLALEVMSPKQAPGQWAHCQTMLGEALIELSDHRKEEQAPMLQQALEALQQGETILTRDSHPGLWANMKFSQGLAHLKPGNLNQDGALLAEARSHFESAIEIPILKQNAPHRWLETQSYLGEIAHTFFSWSSDESWRQIAIEHLQAANDLATQRNFPGWIKRTGDKLDQMK